MGFHGPLGASFTFLYVDVRTSQETPMGFHGPLGASFTFLYVDVRTTQETPIWSSMAYYRLVILFAHYFTWWDIQVLAGHSSVTGLPLQPERLSAFS
jgi:hypothetical protein